MHHDIAIRVEDLSKKYILRQPQTDERGNIVKEHWALKHVSFEIKKGESIGLIGHNGSGKSTLLKILAGIVKPTSGTVQIKGKIASILDIGAGFHPELSGRENVFLSGQTLLGSDKKEIEKVFNEIVEFSGIGKFIDEPVKNYSNGMYLRLAFSIIVHLDFDVYLFDEVLGVGDAAFQERSFEKIRQLATEARKTFLMVSHNIMAMSKLSSRMLFLEKGIASVYSDKKEIINDYLLSQTTAVNPSPVFIKHINLLVSDENGDEKKTYENGEKIIVKIASDFYSIPDDLLIAFRITDIYGNTVFNSSPYLDKIHFQLKNLFRIEIPEYFFNEGFFNVDIVFHNSEKILFEVKRLSKFKVYLNESMKRHKLYGESGVVKPYLKWKNVIE